MRPYWWYCSLLLLTSSRPMKIKCMSCYLDVCQIPTALQHAVPSGRNRHRERPSVRKMGNDWSYQFASSRRIIHQSWPRTQVYRNPGLKNMISQKAVNSNVNPLRRHRQLSTPFSRLYSIGGYTHGYHTCFGTDDQCVSIYAVNNEFDRDRGCYNMP